MFSLNDDTPSWKNYASNNTDQSYPVKWGNFDLTWGNFDQLIKATPSTVKVTPFTQWQVENLAISGL